MGQKNSNQSNKLKRESLGKGNSPRNGNNNKHIYLNLQRNSFDFLYVIGKGGFGKVNFTYKIKGLESFFKKIQTAICLKGNVQSENH